MRGPRLRSFTALVGSSRNPGLSPCGDFCFMPKKVLKERVINFISKISLRTLGLRPQVANFLVDVSNRPLTVYPAGIGSRSDGCSHYALTSNGHRSRQTRDSNRVCVHSSNAAALLEFCNRHHPPLARACSTVCRCEIDGK